MRFRSPSTIRFQLTWLVVTSVLPIWLVSGFLVYQAYSTKRNQVNIAMLSTARALTMVVDRELTNVQSVLLGLASSPSFAAGDLAAVQRQSSQVLRWFPGADIIVADATGQQLVNSFRPYGALLPKRKNSEAVRRIFATGKPVISDLFYGAVTKRPLIGVDVPVIVDGKVKYDLAMAIPIDQMTALLRQQKLPQDWYGTILDSKETLVARSFNLDRTLGKRPNPKLVEAMKLSREGSFDGKNLEGTPVFVTFCRSANSGWTVLVGVPKASGYAEVLQWLGWAIAGSAVISLIGIAFATRYARRIAREIQSLVQPAMSIGRGEVVVTTEGSIRETGEVATALVQASNLIGSASRARHSAESELVRLNDALRQEVLERKAAQEALSNLVQEQTIILENAPIGISKIVDRKLVWVNKKTQELLLCSKQELEGQSTRKLYPSDEAYEKLGQEAYPELARGAVFETVQTLRRKDSKNVIVRYIGKAFDPTDLSKGTLWLLEDITDRKLAEESLRESEEKYRVLFENAGDAIIIHDEGTRVLAANPQACEWLGYGLAELTSMSIRELVSPAQSENTSGRIAQLMTQGFLLFETEIRRSNGALVPVEVNARKIVWHGKSAILSICHDLSEHRNAEMQLLHTQKLESLGVLAGGIAHDFNNILMAIFGNADLALMHLDDQSPVVDHLSRIQAAAARAADLTKQMLAYSGKGRFIVESLDLNGLIEKMLPMLKVSISINTTVKLNLQSTLPMVQADASQMNQAIMNLVLNASEAFGHEVGRITITTGSLECDRTYLDREFRGQNIKAGSYVYLEVADNGCGMDKETLTKLFDPFFSTKFTGRGLGMAAVLGIVKGHQGAIRVHSELGAGTVCKLLLPASGPPVQRVEHDRSGDSWQGNGRVLLVDDEEAVRRIGAALLEALGFTPIMATDGLDALRVFKETPDIALVLLDLTMPRMDGIRCFHELRKLDPTVKVIISSGYNEQDVSQKCGEGLSGFIQKPYTLSLLRDTLKTLASA